jgi:hypothetical protein
LKGEKASLFICGTSGKVLVGSLERKLPSGRPKCRQDDIIKMDIKEVRGSSCEVASSDSRKDPVADCTEHDTEPSGSVNG